MRHSLHSHVIYLENAIQKLRDRLTSPHLTAAEREGIGFQLSLAERALLRYREAYALELSVSGPEPPDASGNDRDTGSGREGSNSEKRKEGLVAVEGRARKRPRRKAIAAEPLAFRPFNSLPWAARTH